MVCFTGSSVTTSTPAGARISVTAKTPGSCRRGDTTFAWIRPRKQPQTCMCLYPPHQLQQRALSGRGERKGGTNDGRKRTHHSQSAQCCVCWTHTCQRKLALSRPKELLEIRSHRCLVGGFFLIPPRRSKGFLYCSGDFRLLCSKGMRGEEIQPQLQISRDS